MSVNSYKDLIAHKGHEIVIATYGNNKRRDNLNVAIKCEDCNEVLISFDKEASR